VATAVVPHLVGEFVQQSESKQNTYILIGLVGVVAVAIGAVGLIVNIPLLAVTPVGAALIGVAVWHLQRKKRLEAELQAIAARKKKAGEQTEPMKKA
jgi:Flp pilus assembly protein TadB